jgi:tRNA U34 2-thiouridine synthase MnmA/TrmU
MKALAVFSGGLDSMLAAQLVRAQGIEVLALFFETPFFTSARAERSAAAIQLPFKSIDITDIHLELVRKPKHGYGANMNPCIDCHALMFSQAGRMLDSEGASFIVTGEVLGQRPLSQNKRALLLVASESGFDGLILRPLSARHLPPTVPEVKGWVRRDELLGFSGRSRKPQMELAARFGIRDYPSPAGGCLLTDVIFSRRLKDLLSSREPVHVREIELLKLGRHFRASPRTKLVVGRNQTENEAIQSMALREDLLSQTESVPGPTVIAVGEISPEIEELALALTVAYSDARLGQTARVRLVFKGIEEVRSGKPLPKDRFRSFMIE